MPQVAIAQGVGSMIATKGGQAGQGDQGGQDEKVDPIDTSELKIYKGNLISNLEALLANFELDKQTDKETDKKTGKKMDKYSLKPANNIKALKKELEDLKVKIESQPNCPEKVSMVFTCRKAITVCSELLVEDPPEDVTAQQQQVAGQVTQVKSVTFDNDDQGGDNGGQDQDGPMDAHGRRAKEARMRDEMLKRTQERLDNERDRAYKQKEKMIELMARLTKLEGESQTAKKVIDVLIKGIALFSEISQQWMKLVAFFERIKTMIDISMTKPTEDLARQGQSGLKTRQAGRDLSNFKKKTISKVIICQNYN